MFTITAHPEMDRAFNHVLGNSVLEPVTPSRLTIYLLIRTIDKFHRQKETEFTYLEHIQTAVLVQLLLSKASLTFDEMKELVDKYLPVKIWVLDDSGLEELSLNEAWRARVNAHRNYPVTVKREDVIRPGRETEPPTLNDAGPFVYQHSTIGTFVRRLALACARQTETEIINTFDAFLQWTGQQPDYKTRTKPSGGPMALNQVRTPKGSARRTLFGGEMSAQKSQDLNSAQKSQDLSSAQKNRNLSSAQKNRDLNQSVSMDISLELEDVSDDSDDEQPAWPPTSTPATNVVTPSFQRRLSFHTKLTPHLKSLDIAGSPLKRDQSTVKSENILTAAAGTSQKCDTHGASPYSKLNPPKHFEFLASSRIRDLILKQLHCLQVAPVEALRPTELQMICKYVKDNYTDLPSVHLLEALNEIRCKRVNEAEDCLRLFFDWNMIRLNESGYAPLGKIGRMDVMPLRYAPLLTARLCRIFGQKERAQHLLYEAVQQAEADKDQLCMRLCLIEQAALEMLPQQRIEQEQETNREDVDKYRFAPVMINGEFQHTTISSQTTLSLLTFDDSGYVEFGGGRPEGTGGHVAHFPIPNGPLGAATSLLTFDDSGYVEFGGGRPEGTGGHVAHFPIPNGPLGAATSLATGAGPSASPSQPHPQPLPQTSDQLDSRAFHLQLNHCLSLMKCIDCAKKCINFNLVNICLERLIYADYGTGRETQARLISDCARAVISTLQLGSGLTTSAAATSEHLLNLNQGDMHCSRFDTEAQVRRP
uniref:Anaphase-promoting complex subunit 5 n=1 Tax=Steinernema glaseri TaxID=37863 RepID=A0A1I7Z447_9BILA